jgi:EAL domain-containing protein (putative c-di-GMP-specific phosphodiesterase class I)
MDLARAIPASKMTVKAAGIQLFDATKRDPEARERIAGVLRSEQINTLLQPIVQMRGARKVVGVEALSRFPIAPVRPPNEWFAEAADVGLGEELELLAIKTALTQLDSLPNHLYISVNVSPNTVVNASLGICFWGTNWSRVVLEITEHAPVEDYQALNDAIAPLKKAGARLAVDDAGARFASLKHIVSVAPDIIKLDMVMSRNAVTDRGTRAMVAALVSFARESGAVVVAEGIETYEQLDLLRDLGVDYGQGYLLGRPTQGAG